MAKRGPITNNCLLQKKLDELTPQERRHLARDIQVYIMVTLQGCTRQEAAEAVGIHRNTAGSTAKRMETLLGVGNKINLDRLTKIDNATTNAINSIESLTQIKLHPKDPAVVLNASKFVTASRGVLVPREAIDVNQIEELATDELIERAERAKRRIAELEGGPTGDDETS